MNVAFRMLIVVLAVSVLELFSGRLALAQMPQLSFEVFPGAPASVASQSVQFSVQILQNGKSGISPVYETQNPNSPNSTPTLPPPQPLPKPSPPFESTTAWTGFATNGPVTVQVTNNKPFQSARILPSHAQIVPKVSAIGQVPAGYHNVVSFTMSSGAGPQQVSVEFCYSASGCNEETQTLNDIDNPLLVFVNPVSDNIPRDIPLSHTLLAQPGSTVPPLGSGQTMVYFGPGAYDLGSSPYVLETNQVAFLAGGAYVKGMFEIADGSHGTAIEGLGILSGKGVCAVGHGSACNIMIDGSQITGNVTIRGITVVDSTYYNIKLHGTGNIVSNIKVISWLPNTDGITPGSGTLSDSFFKTGDDAIKLYSSNLTVSRCTLWQLGNAAPFEMGVNLSDDVSYVTVENSDVIRTEWVYPNRSNAVLSAAFGGNATASHYTFRDIRVENTNPPGFQKENVGLVFQLFKLAVIPNTNTSMDNNKLGAIKNVTFSNIQVTDPPTLPNLFQSFDAQHQVSGITFNNVIVAGQTQQPMPTFNANRNLSLSGTVFSNILWRSTTQPTYFLAGVFTDAAGGQPFLLPAFNGALTRDLSVQGIGDFDGNGYASVLFRNSANGMLYLWDQPLSSQPTFGSIANLDSGFEVAGIGDFNGDGRSDILLWSTNAAGGLVLLMGGTHVIGSIPVAPVTSSNWSVVGIGDIDQEGHSDIILRDQNTNVDVLSFRHGTGPYGITYAETHLSASEFTYSCGSSTCNFDQSWTIAGVGDIRGNGYASILWVNPTTSQVGVTGFAFEAPPKAAFGALLAEMPSGYQIASQGDFNGDGTMDILLFNPGNGEQRIWYTGYYGENVFYTPGPPLALLPGYTPQPYQVGPPLPPLLGHAPKP